MMTQDHPNDVSWKARGSQMCRTFYSDSKIPIFIVELYYVYHLVIRSKFNQIWFYTLPTSSYAVFYVCIAVNRVTVTPVTWHLGEHS